MAQAGALTAAVTDAELACYREDGFTIINRPIFSSAELDEVERLLRDLLARRNEIAPVLVHNLGAGDSAARIDEIVWTTRLEPRLKRTAVFSRARRVASALCGGPVVLHFDHIIDKPAHSEAETPWHQDRAFEDHARDKLTVWVPLVDVDEVNGCLRYLPMSEAMVEHEPVGQGALRAVGIDTSAAVSVLLERGGVSVHRELTLHSAGANRSDRSRPVWVLRFRRDGRSPLIRMLSEVRRGTSAAPVLSRVTHAEHIQDDYLS